MTAVDATRAPLTAGQIAEVARAVLDSVATIVVGGERALELAVAAVLARGHVLFEDVPGLGKTLAARTLAAVLGLSFRRLQCTPDLLPGDVTGSFVFSPTTDSFDFHPGPVFAGLLLADEINRATPKTQSALLEAMQESQVTVEGRTFALPRPFHLLATSNPIEYEGTFPLPEAQLDRFLVRLEFGYPSVEREREILRRALVNGAGVAFPAPVIDAETLLAAQAGLDRITVEADVIAYCVDIASSTRTHVAVEVGASPRATVALVTVARALAAMAGRSYVLPDDVKAAAPAVLAHRLTLSPDAWARRVRSTTIVDDILKAATAPAAPRSRFVPAAPGQPQGP